jgi:hypothetical protein
MGLIGMYGHTSQPPSECDNYEIGKVVIHRRNVFTYVLSKVRCRNYVTNSTEPHWFASWNRSRSLDPVARFGISVPDHNRLDNDGR